MNTAIGALIAAAILFLSNMVTLFTNDPTLEFNGIPTSVWVVICGGALVSFLKDFNGQTFRKAINKVTNSGDGGI